MQCSGLKISFLVILLIADSQCGIVDGIIGTVTNTTHGVKQDIKNVWSFSKSVVFGKDSDTKEHEDGLVGGWIHTVKDQMHRVHAYIWSDDEIPGERGFVTNMYNRVKNRLSKIKGLIFRSDIKAITANTTQSEEAKLVKETLEKLFFGNGTRKVQDNAFNEVLTKLRQKLINIRQHLTDSTPKNLVEDPVIDLRGAADNVRESFDKINNIDVGSTVDVYDRVEETANKVSKVKKVLDEVKENRIGNFKTESSKE